MLLNLVQNSMLLPKFLYVQKKSSYCFEWRSRLSSILPFKKTGASERIFMYKVLIPFAFAFFGGVTKKKDNLIK